MSLAGRDIVCLSTHYWDERRFRKQEFMSRFARRNRVLFVEPSFSMARRPEPHLRTFATNRFLLARIEQRDANLHLLKPPRGLPKWSNARVERLTYRWYSQVIGRAVRRLGFRDAILWVYRPSYHHGLDSIPHGQVVFDMVDDLAAYDGSDGGMRHVQECVDGLVRASDLLVVTAKTLAERYAPAARRLEVIPNGFDPARFVEVAGSGAPAGLAGICRPILGFIGTIFPFLDFELLDRVARFHSDKSLVMVGPVENSARGAMEQLMQRPNVHHMGAQPQSTIPAYIAAFDVCLNVFRVNRVSDSVIPLKVFEYLAAGKPVVSAPMRALELEDAASQIVFAHGPTEFCRQITRCLQAADDGSAAERRRAVAPYTWDRLFGRLDAACEAALGT